MKIRISHKPCLICGRPLPHWERNHGIPTCYYCDRWKDDSFMVIQWTKPIEYIKRLFNIGKNYN